MRSSEPRFVAASPAGAQLPLPVAPLVGRDRETTALRQLLSDPQIRLVAVAAPGGVGKTSLELQVAHELAPEFAGSAYFISLAAIQGG